MLEELLIILVGNYAFGWEADHAEPGVSIVVDENKGKEGLNIAYSV